MALALLTLGAVVATLVPGDASAQAAASGRTPGDGSWKRNDPTITSRR